jgi:hypothetical protein
MIPKLTSTAHGLLLSPLPLMAVLWAGLRAMLLLVVLQPAGILCPCKAQSGGHLRAEVVQGDTRLRREVGRAAGNKISPASQDGAVCYVCTPAAVYLD